MRRLGLSLGTRLALMFVSRSTYSDHNVPFIRVAAARQ